MKIITILAILFSHLYLSGETMPLIKPCPDKPNCVSSLGTTEYSKVSPLNIIDSVEVSKKKIKDLMSTLPRTELVTEKENYLHFTCKTKILRFTDDVEFEFIEKDNLIHIKSASRTGYKDFGVNRERLEKIKGLFK